MLSVSLPDEAVLLSAPGPLDPITDVHSAVAEALRFPLSGQPLDVLATRGGRATVVVEPPALPIPDVRDDPRRAALAATLDELTRAGISPERQTVLVAGGLGEARRAARARDAAVTRTCTRLPRLRPRARRRGRVTSPTRRLGAGPLGLPRARRHRPRGGGERRRDGRPRWPRRPARRVRARRASSRAHGVASRADGLPWLGAGHLARSAARATRAADRGLARPRPSPTRRPLPRLAVGRGDGQASRARPAAAPAQRGPAGDPPLGAAWARPPTRRLQRPGRAAQRGACRGTAPRHCAQGRRARRAARHDRGAAAVGDDAPAARAARPDQRGPHRARPRPAPVARTLPARAGWHRGAPPQPPCCLRPRIGGAVSGALRGAAGAGRQSSSRWPSHAWPTIAPPSTRIARDARPTRCFPSPTGRRASRCSHMRAGSSSAAAATPWQRGVSASCPATARRPRSRWPLGVAGEGGRVGVLLAPPYPPIVVGRLKGAARPRSRSGAPSSISRRSARSGRPPVKAINASRPRSGRLQGVGGRESARRIPASRLAQSRPR